MGFMDFPYPLQVILRYPNSTIERMTAANRIGCLQSGWVSVLVGFMMGR
jgi:hypothetical protein